MIKEYFVDTGGFYALIDAKDPDHQKAEAFFEQVPPPSTFTSNYVFDEVMTLVQSHLGHHFAIKLGKEIRNQRSCHLIYLSEKEEIQAWELFQKRKDKEYSFTDCTSFVFCESRNISDVLSFDRHFKQEGFLCWQW